MKKNKIYKTIDLFAGIGGIRIAFERAGFETVFANDFDEYCKKTYDLNFSEIPLLVNDLTKISTQDIPDFDVLLGGFPCQPFSVAGYRKGFDDKGRGNLFFEILRILKQKSPEAFMLENVKNLEGHDKGRTYKIIKESLERLGYGVTSKVLNTMTHGGVPQNRERIFIIGFKSEKALSQFDFPEEVSLDQNFRNLLDRNVDSKYYYNGKPLYEKIKDDVLSEDFVYQWRRVYVRVNKSGVCPTLTANMGMGGHNVPIIKDKGGIRKLTPRECARLQGFPDSYKLPEMSDSRLYKQFGNSVTISLVERVAKKILEALNS